MVDWVPLVAWRSAGGSTANLADGLEAAGLDPARPAAALWVPGRIELLGKHTDYAGGRSMVLAIDRGLSLLASPRQGSTVHWRDLRRGVEVRFDLADPEHRPGHWSDYLRAPARRAITGGEPFSRGVDVTMSSDLPSAAGLSSSSALVVAAHLVFAAADGDRDGEFADRLRLAEYLAAVESGAASAGPAGGSLDDGLGVGTEGGSEDHAAIVCSTEEGVLELAFSPTIRFRRLAWPSDWELFVGCTGVRAKKTAEAREPFNQLARQASLAAAAVGRAHGAEIPNLGLALAALGSARRLDEVLAEGVGAADESLRRRARHFALECEQVDVAAQALEGADLEALGRAAARSQAGAEELLANQTDETSALCRMALAAGAQAASAFGAGFGGSVWAISPAGEVDHFLDRWRAAYTAAFPQYREASRFFGTSPSSGARWLAPPTTDPPKP